MATGSPPVASLTSEGHPLGPGTPVVAGVVIAVAAFVVAVGFIVDAL